MADQGYPSKRRRNENQARQMKRPQSSQASPGQPQMTTSTPAMNPIIPQDTQGYAEIPQALLLPDLWESFPSTEPMEWQPDGSQKFSSPALSYVNVSTPSGELAGSYGMVHSRSSGAYSNGSGSNQASEESGEGQQAFYSPPWTPGVGCNIEREVLQEFQLPVNYQTQALLHLGAPKPEPVYDPYQQYAASGSGHPELDFEHYAFHPPPESPPPKIQTASTPPWNQIDHRVPRYDGSIAAFELSPGPAGTPEALQQYLSAPSRKSKVSSRKPSTSGRPSKTEPGRKEKSVSPGWEHIVVRNGGMSIVSEHVDEERHVSGGRRTRKLEKGAKEKAARVRQAKACWRCWLAKVPCSEGEVCERCLKYCSKKSFQSPTADQLCSRSGFNDFEPSLFPDYLHSHLTKHAIEALLKEHSRGFKDDSSIVYVTTGSVFQAMGLKVHFFKPEGGFESELVKQHHLTTVSEENASRLVCRQSASVGLMNLSTPELKTALRKHIEDMLSNPQYAAQTTAGDTSSLPRKILEFAIKYEKATESSLVHNALMLHAIYYYMGRLITFTSDSAFSVFAACEHLSFPPEPFLSSRLLSRQLKFAMNRLHRELTRLMLHDLEKALRSRTKDVWGPSFAAILVLGLCVEDLQTAADTFVVCDIKKELHKSQYRREMSWAACRDVEEVMWAKCTSMFHEIYRSTKTGNGGGREGGFNPLRAVEEGVESELELNVPTQELVRDIYGLVGNDREALMELSQRPAIVHFGYEAVMDPNDIKINNTGRLTAKFLMMFFARESSMGMY